jgi:negative regulator of flagellin synthesis FlgM
MQIRPTSQLNQASSVSFNQTRSTGAVQQPAQMPVDQVDISFEAQMLAGTQADSVRAERVATIKAQIASGVYETPDKLDAAVSRMLDEMV